MKRTELSEIQAGYLKHIFLLKERSGTVTTNALSDRLGVRPASVTGMLKKLADLNLVQYEPYKGVTLSEAGQKIALELVRHHRLLELYLSEALGYGWEEVHDEAERLEHVISESLEARISEFLGHPEYDPHGDPIPSVKLELPVIPDLMPLSDMGEGMAGFIRRVRTQDRDMLNLLRKLELVPGTMVRIIEHRNEIARIELRGERLLIPAGICSILYVECMVLEP